MELHYRPWRWTPTGLVRLHLPEIAALQHDESVHVSATDDGKGGTLVRVWRSGENPGPLRCVIEDSEDGVTWAGAATVLAQGQG